MPTNRKGSTGRRGLSIREGLLFGFGAMGLVMVLTVLASLITTSSFLRSVSDVIERQVPSTLNTLRLARAADAVAASGASIALLINDQDQFVPVERMDRALSSLRDSLDELNGAGQEVPQIKALADRLADNIARFGTIVDERVVLANRHVQVQEELMSMVQLFERQLHYRVRILQGDSDVINSLMAKPAPPMGRVAEIVRDLPPLVSVARFYGEVESIHRRLLTAMLDPTEASLAISRETVFSSLESARRTLEGIPPEVARDLYPPFRKLQQLVISGNGVIALRERELEVFEASRTLVDENHQLVELIDQATRALVSANEAAIQVAAEEASGTHATAIHTLLISLVVGLLLIGSLMYLHVNRNVIARLARLSEDMQSVAAGDLDIPLPEPGDDELGRLSAALAQFRKTAKEADAREVALKSSNARADAALTELELKAQELQRANRQLEALSITDGLTGLYNRRRFDDLLENEWARVTRAGKPLALIMIDVDQFKAYNDHYGHQAGDKCLRRIARVFDEKARRAGDHAARYGGEEFCVLCAYTNVRQAMKLAEEIRHGVEALEIKHEYSHHGHVTVSLGVAVMSVDNAISTEELLKQADEQLYDAKAGGRNQVSVDERMIPFAM